MRLNCAALRVSILLSLAVSPVARADIDPRCMMDCQARYTGAYCQSACSYSGPGTSSGVNASIAAGVRPIGAGIGQAMMEIEQMRVMQEQQRVLQEQRRALQAADPQRDAEARRVIPYRGGEITPPSAQSPDPFLQQFLNAAAPRRRLYPDFEQVAFAKEVAITPDMVRLMADSPYAADMAYYLGKHPYEAGQISRLPILGAAERLRAIEAEAAELALRGGHF